MNISVYYNAKIMTAISRVHTCNQHSVSVKNLYSIYLRNSINLFVRNLNKLNIGFSVISHTGRF